jgi:hypothetical protein
LIKDQYLYKILVSIILVSLCLVSTVNALGLGPLSLNLNIEKGKETEFAQYISVTNPETNSIHITASVTGEIADFVTLDPQEFDMPAGPGGGSDQPRPLQDVKVIFKMPRELPKTEYSGQIVFTQKAISGGVIGASAQLAVRVKITIGQMAKATFPMYMNALIIVLIIVLIVAIIYSVRGKI